MKKIIFLLVFIPFLSKVCFSQIGWQWQYPEYSGEKINYMYFFPSASTGWAAGDGGVLLKTTNNGSKWQLQPQFTSINIVWIKFVNSQTGWLSCNQSNESGTFRTTNGGLNWNKITYFGFKNCFFIDGNTGWIPAQPSYILKTTNGGANWEFNSIAVAPNDVFFIDSETGFVSGFSSGSINAGHIMKSTNGGVNWAQVGGNFDSIRMLSIWFQNALSGWSVADNKKAYKTTNGGTNWFPYPFNLNGDVESVQFFNMDNGVIISSSECIKTSNGGNNWISIKQKNEYGFSSTYFKNIDTGFISNSGAQMMRTFNSGVNWQYLYGENNTKLNDIKFFDANTGFAVGDKGNILKTTNGGINWIYSNVGIYTLNSVAFYNNQTVWVSGNGILLKSTNLGVNWLQKSAPIYNITCINFKNQLTGWLTGDTLCKTIDGGNNWVIDSYVVNGENIQFVDSLTGWIGGDYELYKTTNGGINWFNQPDGSGVTGKGFYFINSLTGWEFSYYNQSTSLWKTTNGGNNWIQYSPLIQGFIYFDVIEFSDSQNGFILANNRFYRTSNGGEFWKDYGRNSSIIFNSMDFISSQTGWIAGDNFSIKKTINGGVYVKKESNIIPNSFILFQNYPNPFNPSTTIKYQIVKNSFVTLRVYDILGREVAVLVNEFQSAGVYETQFPNNSITINQLSSGIYFYRLEAKEFYSVKRMVLVK
jgi:photosystem II stability/assembly factor-like uncharacterized protein